MSSYKFCKFFRFVFQFSVISLVGIVNCSLMDDPLWSEIYQSYLNAFNNAEGTVSARRVMSNNKNYEIHIIKLEEVNGFKKHNLLIKESNATNPIIYINNPVETKVPHTHLTFEEFKKELTDRVLKARHQFMANVSRAINRNLKKKGKISKENRAKIFNSYINNLIKRKNKINETISNTKGKTNQMTNNMEKYKQEGLPFRIYTLKTDAASKFENTKVAVKNKGTVATTEQITSKGDVAEPTTTVPEMQLEAEEQIKSKDSIRQESITTVSEMLLDTTEQIESEDDVTEPTTTVPEVLLEMPTTGTSAKQNTESEVTEDLKTENLETAPVIQQEPTQSSKPTTEERTTKRVTLGKPLVFVDEEEEEPGDAI